MGKEVNLYQMSLDFGDDFKEQEDDKYTSKKTIVQYQPCFKEKASVLSLIDKTKYLMLKSEIERSNISDEDKKFLIMCATRHIVFNYDKIAEYYCHSNKEVQELMEKSALIIIDFDDAIENGYIKYSENIEKIMASTGREAKEEYHNQARDTRKQ